MYTIHCYLTMGRFRILGAIGEPEPLAGRPLVGRPTSEGKSKLNQLNICLN